LSRQTLTALLLAGSIVFLTLALATLLPSTAPKISDLGYATFCPFAPWSTLALLFFAGLSWVIRQYVKSQPV
jgi:hypothetical protein